MRERERELDPLYLRGIPQEVHRAGFEASLPDYLHPEPGAIAEHGVTATTRTSHGDPPGGSRWCGYGKALECCRFTTATPT